MNRDKIRSVIANAVVVGQMLLGSATPCVASSTKPDPIITSVELEPEVSTLNSTVLTLDQAKQIVDILVESIGSKETIAHAIETMVRNDYSAPMRWFVKALSPVAIGNIEKNIVDGLTALEKGVDICSLLEIANQKTIKKAEKYNKKDEDDQKSIPDIEGILRSLNSRLLDNRETCSEPGKINVGELQAWIQTEIYRAASKLDTEHDAAMTDIVAKFHELTTLDDELLQRVGSIHSAEPLPSR